MRREKADGICYLIRIIKIDLEIENMFNGKICSIVPYTPQRVPISIIRPFRHVTSR